MDKLTHKEGNEPDSPAPAENTFDKIPDGIVDDLAEQNDLLEFLVRLITAKGTISPEDIPVACIHAANSVLQRYMHTAPTIRPLVTTPHVDIPVAGTAPSHTQVERTLDAFAERLEWSADAVRNHNYLIARLVQILVARAIASTTNDHAAAPIVDRATAPAVNPVETLALQHHLPTAPATHPNAMSPLVGSPIADTATGPSAAYVPPPRLPTTTPSAVHTTMPLKRKVWDLYGEDNDEPGASMVASSSKRGVLPNVGSSSRLGARSSVRGHNSNYVKQGGPSRKIYDCSDDKATTERLLAIIKPGIFFDLDFASKIYRQAYGCFLMARGVKPNHFVNKLAKMGEFEHWLPRLTTTDSTGLACMNILRRCDAEFPELCLDVLRQLGLAKDRDAVVLGPRLCHTLVSMCGIRVDLMTGPIIDSMFWTITRRHLQTLYIATQHGIRQMTANDICLMIKHWVERLCQFIATNNGMKRSLVAARECNDYYKEQCGDDSHGDPGGLLAKEILKGNILLSPLFLGVEEANFKTLCKRLVYVADKVTSPRTMNYLQQMSKQLSNRPSTL